MLTKTPRRRAPGWAHWRPVIDVVEVEPLPPEHAVRRSDNVVARPDKYQYPGSGVAVYRAFAACRGLAFHSYEPETPANAASM